MAVKMAIYIKRLLNVLFVLCSAWALFVIGAAVVGLAQLSRVSWEGWFESGVLPALGGYFALAAINYISFGKLKLWHSSNE